MKESDSFIRDKLLAQNEIASIVARFEANHACDVFDLDVERVSVDTFSVPDKTVISSITMHTAGRKA